MTKNLKYLTTYGVLILDSERTGIRTIQGVDMLDTGSYFTLLRSSVAVQCNLKSRKTKKVLFGVGSVSVLSVISALGKADAMISVDGVETLGQSSSGAEHCTTV